MSPNSSVSLAEKPRGREGVEMMAEEEEVRELQKHEYSVATSPQGQSCGWFGGVIDTDSQDC